MGITAAITAATKVDARLCGRAHNLASVRVLIDPNPYRGTSLIKKCPHSSFLLPTRSTAWVSPRSQKVDVRLPGKGNSNSHGARPVHLILTMIKWIWTSSLSIKNSASDEECLPAPKASPSRSRRSQLAHV